jgi:hypothetical protein
MRHASLYGTEAASADERIHRNAAFDFGRPVLPGRDAAERRRRR